MIFQGEEMSIGIRGWTIGEYIVLVHPPLQLFLGTTKNTIIAYSYRESYITPNSQI